MAHQRRDVSEREGHARPRNENADTAFKRTLAELEVGSEVDVEPPRGFMLPADTSRPLVFVAGGIGITVFRSMLRYIAEDHHFRIASR